MNETLSKMEVRKASIVEDFSIIRDVLSLSGPSKIATQDEIAQSFSLDYIDNADTESIMYQAFKKSLENNLKQNNIPHTSASTIGDQLAAYDILLVPDVVIAKAIVAASQKCYYMTEYVSANWKSFEDLWHEGLGYVVEQCDKNKDIIHFLILQNINLTYLPNYMQPIIDLQSGAIDKLPKYGIKFPENLRIICTLTEDDIIPLSSKCLKYIGCIEPSAFNKEYYGKFISAIDPKCGFLTPTLLLEARTNTKNVPNFYKEYIDE